MMQDLLKIVNSLEDSGILLDGITETVKNEVKVLLNPLNIILLLHQI